ncbi:MAG: hypothetical protein FJ039_01205 [Chloroflexi bacterium]|nr:hypothetical protein [Chloroflexota bacterium]
MSEPRALQLAWSEREGLVSLEVRGWTAEELRAFQRGGDDDLSHRLAILPSELVAAMASFGSLQPLAGRFAIIGDSLRFTPRFPFLDGLSYSLLVRRESGPGFEEWRIRRPAPSGAPTTRVLAIYPTAEEVPFNLLKFYIHFSNPMSEGKALRSVHVRRADTGTTLEDVFVVMDELWDPERRRLTLLLDPGRIKRGLAPHEESGYPLIEGVPITLAIDTSFRDASGMPLQAAAERGYAVGAALRLRVDPKAWRIRPPKAGSKEALVVDFDRPLDHALLQHCLWVRDGAGKSLPGHSAIGPREQSWRFEPERPWAKGRYTLVVDPRLEDLAGNSLTRLFDRDLERAEDAPADTRLIEIPFTCGL